MKSTLAIALILMAFWSCKQEKTGALTTVVIEEIQENILTISETTESIVLFDGASFENFKEYLKEEVSEHWKIEDNAMVFYPPKNREKGEAYNLVTKNDYTDFVLFLEWKISEGGNSGIFWGVKEDSTLAEAYQTGPEIKVLDNDKHPDGKAGLTHQAGALYDRVAPTEDVTKPVGEWNTCLITINHKTNKGSVVLNRKEILVFPVNNSEWHALVAKSKFANWEHFGKYPTGKIGLQDHGDMVSFRNIKIKEL